MAACLEKDITCSICHDIFTEPVVLSCSHSFCKGCVQKWWRGKLLKECPLCKTRPLGEPTDSSALKNLCEAFTQERERRASAGSEAGCSLHREKLRLFCLDHQQLVCPVCRDSKAHSNHRFRPISEAAQDQREELQKSLRPLRDKLEVFERVKRNWDQTAKHIKVQTRNTVKEIKDQFKKFHQLLQEEEEERIGAVRKEEELKSKMQREKMEDLSRQIAEVSDTLRATQKVLRCPDLIFLHNYKAVEKEVQQRSLLDDPEMVSGALIDEAKHLGNLRFNMWNKMKEMVCYSPVVLDPNSAHPELILSEELTRVRREDRQKLPDNLERFDCDWTVLGSEGFCTGTHSWDVEVADNLDWVLGVAAEPIQKKGETRSRLWRLEVLDGTYAAVAPSLPPTALHIQTLRRIRVLLDQDRGQLTFSDAETLKHIYSSTLTFKEKLFPYFCNKKKKQKLKILPKKIYVTIQ